jgi:hypothetical protein
MARLLSFVLGLWIFTSAWLWPHPHFSLVNAAIVGALVAWCSLWAARRNAGYWANATLSAWLFLSTLLFTMPRVATVPSRMTLWSNSVAAALVLLSSFLALGRATSK